MSPVRAALRASGRDGPRWLCAASRLGGDRGPAAAEPMRPPNTAPNAEIGTLVVAETVALQQPGGAPDALRPSLANAVTAALEFKEPVSVLIGGASPEQAAEEAARVQGVDEVFAVKNADLASGLAEPWAALLLWLLAQDQRAFSRVVASSSAFSRSLLPRAAALLDAPMVSDIVSILSADSFVRPIYAGNALATVKCLGASAPAFLTTRPTAFAAAPIGGSAPVETINYSADEAANQSSEGPQKEALRKALAAVGKSKWVGQEVRAADRPDLSSAKVVVSGGRGLKSKEGFQLLETLADKLGGAVGASRAAVDAGFVPNELQVGQTGKVVAPDLYIAVGISGAIQHLAGMKDSKTIVAINKDADAPVFQVADYGLVADLFNAIPELTNKIKAKQ